MGRCHSLCGTWIGTWRAAWAYRVRVARHLREGAAAAAPVYVCLLCMYVFMCACVWRDMCARAQMRVHICAYVYVCGPQHARAAIFAPKCCRSSTCVWMRCVCVCMYVCMRIIHKPGTHVCICICEFVYACIHVP